MHSFKQYLHEQLQANATIEPEIKKFFLSDKTGILYGAGWQSRIALEFAQFFDKKIACLLVSPGGKRTLCHYTTIPMYVIGRHHFQ